MKKLSILATIAVLAVIVSVFGASPAEAIVIKWRHGGNRGGSNRKA